MVSSKTSKGSQSCNPDPLFLRTGIQKGKRKALLPLVHNLSSRSREKMAQAQLNGIQAENEIGICTLGVDLGTSGLRCVIMEAATGVILDSAQSTPYSVDCPVSGSSGWREQHPSVWCEAFREAVSDLRKRRPDLLAKVVSLAVAGHMHGAVCLDKNGHVLRPCILWNDTRAAEEARALDSDTSDTTDSGSGDGDSNNIDCTAARIITGNIVYPGFTAPKLLWMSTNEPEIFSRVKTVLLPASYLNYWLTGEITMDHSDAAGTAWYDLQGGCWSETMLSKTAGMTADQMPRLVSGCDTIGTIGSAGAGADDVTTLGLPLNCEVAGGAGDNAAAACGVGVLCEGQGFVSLGTSGVLLASRQGTPLSQPSTSIHTFCHATPFTHSLKYKRWYQMGVILSCTDCLNWFGNICKKTPMELTAALPNELPLSGPSETVRFYPYLSGERTPHNDANIRGSFVGLSTDTSENDMTKAVIEGVCFALKDSLESLLLTNVSLTSLLAIGGGIASTYWLKTLATVLNLQLDVPAKGDFGAALGAARIALAAYKRLGCTPPAPTPTATAISPNKEILSDSTRGLGEEEMRDRALVAIMFTPEIDYSVLPDNREGIRQAYDKAYKKYRYSYPLLKALQCNE